MLTIRSMQPDDLPLVARLKTQAGWNQTTADLQRFQALSQDGSFVAEWNGVPVGTVATFVFGDVAWIAMMLVDAEYRGRGFGRSLMNRALMHLDENRIPTIRLDATPLGRPLYETLGFVPQFELSRYAGQPQPSHAEQTRGAILIRTVEPADLVGIEELDRTVTKTHRRQLLERLYAEPSAEWRVAVEQDRTIGYVASRPGANARQIGPCVALPKAGSDLLSDALRRYQGEPVFIDVPCEQFAAVDLVASHGLSPQRTLTRMCRGGLVVEELACLWASSSPEKG